MKKMILAAAVTGCLAFAACNNTKLGPEASTPPVINSLAFNPTGTIDSTMVVTITADITSEYGFYYPGIGINYQLNDDPATLAGSLAHSDDSSPNSFVATIPKQPDGTKVDFIFIAQNPYYALIASQQYTYTVGDPAGITPVTQTPATPAQN